MQHNVKMIHRNYEKVYAAALDLGSQNHPEKRVSAAVLWEIRLQIFLEVFLQDEIRARQVRRTYRPWDI